MECEAVLDELKAQLHCAQQKMKGVADAQCRDVHFEVGDLVYLKICLYQQHSLAIRTNENLAPRFFGPYKVLAKIRHVVYRLQLLDSMTIHPMFHVSQLHRAIGTSLASVDIPPQLSEEFEMLVEPAAVLDLQTCSPRQVEVLIRWEGCLILKPLGNCLK